MYSYFFFFSSRRRHTRCSRDWSSDVCSSDLTKVFSLQRRVGAERSSRRSMELSVDAFNFINHTNVSNIVGVVSSPLFGQADAAGLARTIQLSVKYSF